MRDLRPSSIDAAVLHKKKELEAKDPRVEVQIDTVNGRQNIILNAKEELKFTVGFNTSDPATIESVRDFFEKGTDLEITRGDNEFKGSPLFEELQMPKNRNFPDSMPIHERLMVTPFFLGAMIMRNQVFTSRGNAGLGRSF